ncbi:hypothetical protein K1719_012083 [Acacia pycnantha]|nr:hypothetical protein K1719_012083 [Acacia pycnantha]
MLASLPSPASQSPTPSSDTKPISSPSTKLYVSASVISIIHLCPPIAEAFEDLAKLVNGSENNGNTKQQELRLDSILKSK